MRIRNPDVDKNLGFWNIVPDLVGYNFCVPRTDSPKIKPWKFYLSISRELWTETIDSFRKEIASLYIECCSSMFSHRNPPIPINHKCTFPSQFIHFLFEQYKFKIINSVIISKIVFSPYYSSYNDAHFCTCTLCLLVEGFFKLFRRPDSIASKKMAMGGRVFYIFYYYFSNFYSPPIFGTEFVLDVGISTFN